MKQIIHILIGASLISSPALAQRGRPNLGGSENSEKKGTSLTPGQKEKFAKANPEDITDENFPETIESFDFPNVDINDVIKAISELTGKNFIIDPGVRGKITIIAPSKITVAEAYRAFLSALAINGFTVVPSGNFLKVKLARNAQRDSIETYSGTYYPNTDQLITRIINLKYIQAEQVTRELTMLTSNNGEMRPYAPTNSIIISDFGSNIDRVMKILTQLDVPGFEDQLEVIPIKYGKAKDLADLVDRIVNKGEKSNSRGGTFSSGVARFSRSGGQTQGGSFFMAIPDDRTNSIVVTGSKSGITRVKKLIAQLDFRIKPEESGGVHVYYVRFGDAEKIAQVLQSVTKDGAPKPASGGSGPGAAFSAAGTAAASTEIFGGDVKISADKSTNSLVIMASKQDYEVVKNLLSKIDIPRDQVFVEAIIMEMKATLDDSWKIGYYQFNEGGVGKTGFNGGPINLSDMLSPSGGQGTIIGFGQGKEISITMPNSTTPIRIPSLTGFINFLKKTTKANILSRPTITVIDNQEGEIEVGERVPTSITTTPATATSAQTQTANFEDATLKLKIKPFISPKSSSVRMEVDQKIQQPTTVEGLPEALSNNTKPLAKRSIKTMIVVDDGNTAILGGLMRDQDNEEIQKVPLLGDLPIIGWLFKARTTTRTKTNLTVFLTPKIIRTQVTQNGIISQKLDQRLEFVKSQGGKDPFGSTVDEIQGTISGVPAKQVPPEKDGDSKDNKDSITE